MNNYLFFIDKVMTHISTEYDCGANFIFNSKEIFQNKAALVVARIVHLLVL